MTKKEWEERIRINSALFKRGALVRVVYVELCPIGRVSGFPRETLGKVFRFDMKYHYNDMCCTIYDEKGAMFVGSYARLELVIRNYPKVNAKSLASF